MYFLVAAFMQMLLLLVYIKLIALFLVPIGKVTCNDIIASYIPKYLYPLKGIAVTERGLGGYPT